jgi:ribosomal protein S18 acetylase RimI-like enzyme
MKLRITTLDDLKVLRYWITDKVSCRIWAGPLVGFPFSVESLIEDISYQENNTSSLVNDEDLFLGMGQIFEKNERLHLARIIVSPDYRGRGFGKDLCIQLIHKGIDKHGQKEFSLNVYKNNKIAINLYKSLGFYPVEKAPYDSKSAEDSIYMILKSPYHF